LATATAYAEQGDFAETTCWQQKAIESATDEKISADFKASLALYRQQESYAKARSAP
jgi:hypothetical protein